MIEHFNLSCGVCLLSVIRNRCAIRAGSHKRQNNSNLTSVTIQHLHNTSITFISSFQTSEDDVTKPAYPKSPNYVRGFRVAG